MAAAVLWLILMFIIIGNRVVISKIFRLVVEEMVRDIR